VLEFNCTKCGKRVQADDVFAGKTVPCPICNTVITAPHPQAIVAPEHAHQAKITPASSSDGSFREGPPPGQNALPSISEDNSQLDIKAKLTPVGCVLTLLTVAIIFGVAVPLVRWRDPVTKLPLPLGIAIFSPFLIGAAFHGIATLILRLVGFRVLSEPEKDEGN
jgi:hypothetical protein